jgi:hypothetical protein
MPIEPMSPGEIPSIPTFRPVGRRRALAVGAAGLGALADSLRPGTRCRTPRARSAVGIASRDSSIVE